MSDTLFLNAYNFVPLLGKECLRESLEKGSLTGKISCVIIPKTDFFIPNTSNETCTYSGVCGKTVREFFSYTQLPEKHEMNGDNAPQHPVIPGSELRGMIRSMYEAMTDSCLYALDLPDLLSSRSNDAKLPGLLHYCEDGTWELIKAEKNWLDDRKEFSKEKTERIGEFDADENGRRYLNINGEKYYGNSLFFINTREEEIKSFDKQKNQMVHRGWRYVVDRITVDESSDLDDYPYEGYLFIGEEFGDKKHYYYIFSISDNIVEVKQNVITNAIKNYNENIRIYQKNGTAMHKDCEIPVNPKKDSYFCVWYEKIGNKLYFSPSCLGRDVYYSKLENYIKGYKPCDSEMLCDACRLFGTVTENMSIGTRIRFSDAQFTGNSKPQYASITTLKELASPRSTCMEMYTKVKENADGSPCWSYDYYKNSKGEKCQITSKELELNGRKFYYHHPACKSEAYYQYSYISPRCRDVNESIQKNSERLITVRPMKGIPENEFIFDVYFEKITEAELQKLLLVLSLCGNDNDNCYKLGMGKPIGLGSVKIKVENVMLRTIEDYIYKFDKTLAYEKFYQGIVEDTSLISFNDALKKITSFNLAQELTQKGLINDGVHYPTAYDGQEGFKWFVNNRIIGRNARAAQFLDASGILRKNKKESRKRRY
ncbi:MAG: TIGR03986 family CRISPR-associated RAMP protein [Clostridiales bacterium]|nr:TIGR03986 family CRISPR-associated RAMP protein [Clostridiales bacterium]